jgi:hypothetical protein
VAGALIVFAALFGVGRAHREFTRRNDDHLGTVGALPKRFRGL